MVGGLDRSALINVASSLPRCTAAAREP